ncbi:gliding motility-associated C-terminal domain-containing protein [uncultured Pontibacter sp.]|uniref:Ig-like domain-containing protein n=1 Tax=uncultured Pontibacter sp. TaxID=453356 RepID=UPI0026199491|nr:gliding motility-associated C-terminal domain-containing protein [uncultured Pontibacter sp.]
MKQLYLGSLFGSSLLFFFFVFSITPLNAQTVQWARSLKGNYTGNFGLSAVDGQGNIFLHGEYTGTVYHGTTALPGAYPATYDRVLIKHSPDGAPLWYKKNKGMKNGIATVGVTDRDGNYYELSGYTNGVFDNSIIQPSGTTAYFTKFTPVGQRQWIKFLNGGFLYPGRLFQNPSGQLVFTMNVEGSFWYENELVSSENGAAFMMQMNPENGSIASKLPAEPYTPFRMDQEGNFYETGMHQAPLVRKLDPQRRLLWQKNINSNTNNTYISNMEVDVEGNTYLTGTYCGRLSIDQLEVSAECNPQQSGMNAFIAKLDIEGNAEWLKDLGQYFNGGIFRLLPHPEGGLYLAGINSGNSSLWGTPLPEGLFISRLSLEGGILWLRSFAADTRLSHLSLRPYPSGLLFASTLLSTSTGAALDLDGHKVAKEPGSHTFFYAYVKEEKACAPIPQVKLPAPYCPGAPGEPVEAVGENIRWYADATGIALLAEGNQYQPTLSTTTTFYVTQSVEGCESRPRAVELKVREKPAAPMSSAKVLCLGDMPVLSALGQNLRWYKDAGLHTLAATGNDFRPAISGSASFYVTQTVDGCESAATEVRVLVNPLPAAPEVSSSYVCDGVLLVPLVAVGSQISWYTDAALTNKVGEGNQYFPANAVPGHMFVTQRVNGCESAAAIAEIKAGSENYLKEKVANIITPNGDGLNDAFAIPALVDGSCIGNFNRVIILNRWGKTVYESKIADFAWRAQGQATGVYFYVLSFDSFTFKGSVTVSR